MYLKDYHLSNILSAEQKLQLSTPTYNSHKEHKKKKISSQSPSPVDSETIKLVGRVESDQVVQDRTQVARRKQPHSVMTPTKASKKKSSKISSDYLNAPDDKWSQRFARLDKSSVLVEPVKQTSTIVTTGRPFIKSQIRSLSGFTTDFSWFPNPTTGGDLYGTSVP